MPAISDNPRPTEPGAIRVGFVTQLLWERYGQFWVDLVRAAGATPVFATRADVDAALPRLAEVSVPGLAFRLAAAQTLALSSCDVLVVPRLNPESNSQRGGAQDRWLVDLPGALQDALALGTELQAVAAYPDSDLEQDAVRLLHRLLGDAAAVPRVWSRVRHAAERQAAGAASTRSNSRRRAEREQARRLASGGATAVVAQPWLVTKAVIERLASGGELLVSQLALDPERCRQEGWRTDEQLIATDAEVLGAVRMLSRRAGVERLRLLVDEGSPTDGWLARRAAKASHKPLEPWPLSAALGAEEQSAVLLNTPDDQPVD